MRRDVEDRVEILRELDAAVDLRRHLLLGAEDVRVVLGHVADAKQAVKRARELVPVQRRALRIADREIAVAPELGAEEEHVPRAVHRLQRRVRLLALACDEEHVLAELLPVAARDPHRRVVDQRRLHLRVAALLVLAPPQVLELVPDHHPLRMPERGAGRLLGEVEEIELAAELAMVARLRLLEALEIGVEIGLGVEGRAVDPRQLLVVLVAAPVGTGERRELDRLDRLRVLEVRAAAEIGELALRIERDVALGGVDELHLVGLVLLEEALLRLGRGDLLALPGAALLELAHDLGLDPLEVLLADRLGELEVVVEAVLDRRPDRDLHARVEPAHGLGEQVRGRVAQHRERVRVVGVPRRQDLDRLPVGERQAEVLDRRRSGGSAPPARRASGRSRARHRGRSRRPEVQVRSNRGERLS